MLSEAGWANSALIISLQLTSVCRAGHESCVPGLASHKEGKIAEFWEKYLLGLNKYSEAMRAFSTALQKPENEQNVIK